MRSGAQTHPASRSLRALGIVVLLVLAGAAGTRHAYAEGRYCSSRDVVIFGNRAVGSNTMANVTISNCGDQAWSFTGVGVDPATGAAFHVDTTCATALVLA